VQKKLLARLPLVAEKLHACLNAEEPYIERLLAELSFGVQLALHHDSREWEQLVDEALQKCIEGAKGRRSICTLVTDVETLLSPMKAKAKEYCVHYVAHAHIDMNWLWPWSDTVKSCYRTFSTMVELMDEFPDFRFSQSQIMTYEIVRRYSPELFERVKEKIRAGQWEVTASTWVEADKNLTSGESQLRQLLYAKQYLREVLEIDECRVVVDWATDTFGHPATTPKILRLAGLKYYYLRRPGSDMQPDVCEGKPGQLPWLFWWIAPDGSKVLVWNNDRFRFVDQHVTAGDIAYVLRHEQATGLKDFLVVYGVGNHGGGPSRGDIKKIRAMGDWPIFPRTQFSTVHEYFEMVEKKARDLPVVNRELNFVYRGCYSSQSRAKFFNRRMENRLPVSEALASIAQIHAGFHYPKKELEQGWKAVLFNQFHDIVTGAGVKETYEHAIGQYHEVEALTSIIVERAIRQIASKIRNTTRMGIPVVVVNPTSYRRTDKVELVLYDVPEDRKLVARDEDGNIYPVQVVESLSTLSAENRKGGKFYDKKEGEWNSLLVDVPSPVMLRFDLDYGHEFVKVVFIAKEIPPYGYKLFWIDQVEEPSNGLDEGGVRVGYTQKGGWLENEFLRVEVDAKSCSIVKFLDKRNSRELVPEGGRFAILNLEVEEPHPYSAWIRGRLKEEHPLHSGGTLEILEKGPVRGVIRCRNYFRNSRFVLDISLYKDLPELAFKLNLDWREFGGRETGVPALRVRFPIDLKNPRFIYEIPFGNTERVADGKEVPAQRWGAAVERATNVGVTILNSHTYSYSAYDNEMALTLLRSSYEPDPVPEIGRHTISYSVFPSLYWTPDEATRLGINYNAPLIAFRTERSNGSLPSKFSFLSVEPSNVVVTALKQAENADGLVLRLFEASGNASKATVHSAQRIEEVYVIDPIERPSSKQRVDLQERFQFSIEIGPYEVKTCLLRFGDPGEGP